MVFYSSNHFSPHLLANESLIHPLPRKLGGPDPNHLLITSSWAFLKTAWETPLQNGFEKASHNLTKGCNSLLCPHLVSTFGNLCCHLAYKIIDKVTEQHNYNVTSNIIQEFRKVPK